MKTKKKLTRAITFFLLLLLSIQIPIATNASGDGISEITPAEIMPTQSSGDAHIVSEDTTLRDEYTKHFVLSDGSMLAASYNMPVHYYDDEWKEIDNTLVSEGKAQDSEIRGFVNTESGVKYKFAQSSAEAALLEMTADGYSVSWEFVADKNSVPAEVTNPTAESGNSDEDILNGNKVISSVKYTNILNDTDIEYILRGNDVKENIVIKAAKDNYTYSFRIRVNGAALVLKEDGSIDVVKGDKTVKTIPAAFMTDANGAYCNAVETSLTEESDGVYMFTVTADKTFVNSAAFPVTVDPQLNDGDAVNYTVAKTQLTENGGENLGDGVVWTGHSAVTDKKARFHVSVPINYMVGFDDYIISAKINLTRNAASDGKGNVVIGAYAATTYFNKNNAHYGSVGVSNLSSDKVLINNSDTENMVYGVDITSVVRMWMRGESENKGIVIEADNVGDADAFAAFDAAAGEAVPACIIRYRSAHGLADGFSFHKIDLGNGGIAYINSATGNLVVVRDDVTCLLKGNTVNISGVYNSIMPSYFSGTDDFYGTQMKSGNGWKLNVQEKITGLETAGDRTHTEGEKLYSYVDSTGTKRYFAFVEYNSENSETVMKDTDGLGLTLVYSYYLGETVRFKLTDKDGNSKYFDLFGYIVRDEEKNGTAVEYEYTGIQYSERRITSLTDAYGTATLEYNEDRTVKSVTDRFGNTKNFTYDANGNLTAVSDAKGTLATYSYDGTKLVSVIDAQNNIKVVFSYNGARLSGAETFDISSDTEFKTQSISLSFDGESSTFTMTDREKGDDGNVEETTSETVSFFDERGRLSAEITDGAVSAYEYDGNSNFFNNIKASADFDDLGNNLIKDLNASAYDFSEYGTNAGGSVSVNTEFAYTGAASLSVASAAVTDMYGYAKTFTAPETGTYTFRAFVKPGALTVSETTDGGAALKLINNTTSASAMSEFVKTPTEAANNNGWSLVSVSIECAAGDSVTLVAGIENATGTALFDGLNFDKGEARSVNLLSNNGFENGLENWTSTGFEQSNSARTGSKSVSAFENASAHTSAYIGLSSERSFTLSGWIKGDIYENNGASFVGLKAKVYYTLTENGVSEQKTAEYSAPAETDIEGWQFVSTTFVPPQATEGQSITVDRTDVFAVSENGFENVLFDDISLVMNAAACFEYTENGDILVEDDFLGNKTNYNYGSDGRLSATATEYTQTTYAYDDEEKTTIITTNVYDLPVGSENRNVVREKIEKFDRYENLIYIKTNLTQSNLSEISSYVYDTSFNYMISMTDTAGNTESYTYNADGKKTSVTDKNGVVKRYEYNSDSKLIKEYTDTNNNAAFDENEPYIMYTYNSDGVLVSTTSNSREYSYIYGSDSDLIQGFKIGEYTVVSYEYTSDKVTKILYANGDYITYTYTESGENDKIRYYNSENVLESEISYIYNTDGLITDIVSGSLKYHYNYNSENKVENISYVSVGTDSEMVLAVLPSDLTETEIVGNGVTFGDVKLEYTGDSLSTGTIVLKNTFDSNSPEDILSVTETKDALNRVVSTTLSGSSSEILSKTYEYATGNIDGTETATQKIERVVYGDGTVLKYTYDGLDRIISVSEGTQGDSSYIVKEMYSYDAVGHVVRNDSADRNITTVFVYDTNGNMLSKTEYLYTTDETVTGEPVSSVNYVYSDAEWKDKLTSYNGQTISYDEIGNPISYRDGISFTWHGQRLKSLTAGTTYASYTYDENGKRLSKTVNGQTTSFVLDRGKTVAAAKITADGTEYLYFFYDDSGSPVGMNYLGNNYYFKKNLQGDIIEIWGTEDGTDNHEFRCLVDYKYDAWGKIISVNDTTSSGYGLGQVNPFRYRGYWYDTESGLYYLQSRYYDPETGRFINADIPTATLLSSGNLYCYCSDDPVNKTDPSGYLDWDIGYAMRAFYHVSGKSRLSALEQNIYDVNGDGELDITDAMLLFYYVAKKITDIRGRIKYINQHPGNKYHRDILWGKYINKTATCAVAALSMSLQAMNYNYWTPEWLIRQQHGSVVIKNSYNNGKLRLDKTGVQTRREEIIAIRKYLKLAYAQPREYGLPLGAYRDKPHWVLVCGITAKGQYVIFDPGRSDNLRMSPGRFDVIKAPYIK